MFRVVGFETLLVPLVSMAGFAKLGYERRVTWCGLGFTGLGVHNTFEVLDVRVWGVLDVSFSVSNPYTLNPQRVSPRNLHSIPTALWTSRCEAFASARVENSAQGRGFYSVSIVGKPQECHDEPSEPHKAFIEPFQKASKP